MTGEVASLAHRIAERRRERNALRAEPIVLPVPGYGDLFAVRYRRLDPSEAAAISEKHDPRVDGLAGPIALLVNACEDILEVTGVDQAGKRVYEPLGRKWSVNTIAELFEEDPSPTVRLAMEKVFDEREISRHFGAYTKAVAELDKDDTEALPGESKPSVEG
jgi:hypothetical protein